VAGYSQTPLVKKLGLWPGMRLLVIGASQDYAALVEGLPGGLQWAPEEENGLDFIHLFTSSQAELKEAFPRPGTPAGKNWRLMGVLVEKIKRPAS